MWFSKKKVEVSSSLVKDALRELTILKKKKFKLESLERLTEILRIFIEERFGLEQSLTIEELFRKLNKKKMAKDLKLNLARVLIQLHEAEYMSKEPIKRVEFNDYIKNVRKIIREIG